MRHIWQKNGDYPSDFCEAYYDHETGTTFKGEGKIVRYYRHPDHDGSNHCPHCDALLRDHGWIDSGGEGRVVCPGDVIMSMRDGYYPVKPDLHDQIFSGGKDV